MEGMYLISTSYLIWGTAGVLKVLAAIAKKSPYWLNSLEMEVILKDL